jgi:CDP-6-deoxy-D-xylo-4-hexulose-3-dehydrase
MSEKPKKVWYAPNMKEAYDDKEIQAVREALEDGWLAPGPRTAEFEARVAAFFGKKYGLFVNSGSSANLVALICAGVGPGVEVLTPACTFSTTVAPLVQLGADIKFCDVHPQRYVPTVDQVMENITENTKIIMMHNLLGNKIDWRELRKRLTEAKRPDIILLEDSCDTMTYTAESDISTTSFYASHIITAGGAGGMVMFNEEKLHARALRLRDWGRAGTNCEDIEGRFNHGLAGEIQYDWKFFYVEFGYNLKACEMNAAFGLVQLDKLKEFERIRHAHFERYIKTLKADEHASKYYKFPDIFPGALLLALPLECKDRMKLLEFLEANEVQTRVTMAGNILRHQLYKETLVEEAKKSFPVADEVMKNGFLVGCHHGMTESDVDRVCALLIEFAKKHV